MTGQREQLCELSDLPPSMCAHCRGLGHEPIMDLDDDGGGYSANALHNGPTGFAAEFPSDCPACGGAIRPGDRIARERDGRRRWVCGPCIDSDEALS
jgi:hypothetical protein